MVGEEAKGPHIPRVGKGEERENSGLLPQAAGGISFLWNVLFYPLPFPGPPPVEATLPRGSQIQLLCPHPGPQRRPSPSPVPRAQQYPREARCPLLAPWPPGVGSEAP